MTSVPSMLRFGEGWAQAWRLCQADHLVSHWPPILYQLWVHTRLHAASTCCPLTPPARPPATHHPPAGRPEDWEGDFKEHGWYFAVQPFFGIGIQVCKWSTALSLPLPPFCRRRRRRSGRWHAVAVALAEAAAAAAVMQAHCMSTAAPVESSCPRLWAPACVTPEGIRSACPSCVATPACDPLAQHLPPPRRHVCQQGDQRWSSRQHPPPPPPPPPCAV